MLSVNIEFFNKDELKCKCCNQIKVSRILLLKIELLRSEVGFPLIPSSCCRCEIKNSSLSNSSKNSSHLFTDFKDTEAIDITCWDTNQRFKIVETAIKIGFKQIGIYENHVHLGLGKTNIGVIYYGKYN